MEHVDHIDGIIHLESMSSMEIDILDLNIIENFIEKNH